jgi:hypothetical protein
MKTLAVAIVLGALSSVAACGSDDGSAPRSPDAGIEGHADAATPVEASVPVEDAGKEPEPIPPRRRMFVTTATFRGNLGGLEGADAKCKADATTAGLQGSFLAWLSTSNKNAIDRFKGEEPWYDVSGAILYFTGRTKGTYPLTGAGPLEQINASATGAPFSSVPAFWTGTMAGGTRAELHCSDWTVETGKGSICTIARPEGFGSAAALDCTAANRLLCVEE